jgi:predicted P-loop ATPase
MLKRDGEPKPLLANAIAAFRFAPEWKGVISYNAFALMTTVTKPPPWEIGSNSFIERTWSPRDDVLATEWLQRAGISIGLDTTQQAVETVARDHEFHPVRNYLEEADWDEKPRIGRWLTTYLGAEDTPYASAIGRSFLISAVARIMRPGCKCDHVLIFEGPQGIGKSRAARVLTDPWFSDELAELGSKDASMQTRAIWLIELAELDSIRGAEASRVKAFISRTTDRFRPPYGRRVIEAPRQCVFIGTTNAESYLKDETGARRFWPVRLGKVDLEALARDRDQLWAEAMLNFKTGQPWWLVDEKLLVSARDEQQDRYSGDPWDDVIAKYVNGRAEVSVAEILQNALRIPKVKWTQGDQNRIARSLRSSGFQRHQVRLEGGGREWRYRRHQ